MVDDILVYWVILTFDRQIKGPFPLPRRYYVLDWTKTSENEQAEIMQILGILETPQEQKDVRLGTVSETFIIGANKPDERMLRFRKMFVEKPIEEIGRLVNDSGKSYRVFTGVNLNREYFEDETCREISKREMMQIATGNKDIILDAGDIVQIGPCPICAKETWTVDKANILFNFIQVVRTIWRSSWARKRSKMTIYPGSIIECDFPTVESMCAVLTLFRQLYASDDLMNRTCQIYVKHSSNETKKQWINFCLQSFEQNIDADSKFIPLHGCTVRELFEAFLYGTGIVHSPNDRDPRNRENRSRLSEIVKQHGREKVIMAVNESFWMALRYAVDVFHIVKQDYEHWTEQEGCAKSDMFNIYSLLRSHGSQ